MNKAIKAIQLAIIYIKNDNIKGLDKVLGIMPLDKLKNEADALLSTFLSTCAEYGRQDAAKLVLDHWKVIYPQEEKIQLLTKLFMINSINLITLAFVVLSHEDYTYVEAMDDLMMADNSPEVVTSCSKADKIFGPQPYSTYELIKTHADEAGNWRVEEYAISNMEENAPYSPVPTWVKNYTDGPLVQESDLYIPETGKIPFEIPSDEDSVDLLTSGLTQIGISVGDLERAKESLRQRLATATKKEKIELLRPVMENYAQSMLGGDTYLFRLFGPANPLVNQDLTLKGKSNMYGGCRMFLCDVFDYNHEYDYVADWFTGVCGSCHLRMKHRWHAIRKPRPHGGWVGCFCSWKCVKDHMAEYGEEPALMTRELIKIFGAKIDEIGIQDRLEDDK